MKQITPIILGIFLFIYGIKPLNAQSHDLNLILNNNGTAPTSEAIGESCMNEGEIQEDYILMQRINIDAAGYLYFQTDVNYASSDNITFSLTNENDANQYYRIQLTGGNATLEASGQTIPLRSFTSGDNFRIVRCSCMILYYHNGSLVHFVEITDDDFPMVGEITVNNALNVALHVQFDQTHDEGNCEGIAN